MKERRRFFVVGQMSRSLARIEPMAVGRGWIQRVLEVGQLDLNVAVCMHLAAPNYGASSSCYGERLTGTTCLSSMADKRAEVLLKSLELENWYGSVDAFSWV